MKQRLFDSAKASACSFWSPSGKRATLLLSRLVSASQQGIEPKSDQFAHSAKGFSSMKLSSLFSPLLLRSRIRCSTQLDRKLQPQSCENVYQVSLQSKTSREGYKTTSSTSTRTLETSSQKSCSYLLPQRRSYVGSLAPVRPQSATLTRHFVSLPVRKQVRLFSYGSSCATSEVDQHFQGELSSQLAGTADKSPHASRGRD